MNTGTVTSWHPRHREPRLRDARGYRRTRAVVEVADGEPGATVAGLLRVTLRPGRLW